MPNENPNTPGGLLDYLPAIYHEDRLLGDFLLAFEKLLTGGQDAFEIPPPDGKGWDRLQSPAEPLESDSIERKPPAELQPIETTIAGIADLFDPRKAPADFIPWLAAWTSFTMRADLELPQQRKFISEIIHLYTRRGTKQNLIDLLKIFTIGEPQVVESSADGFRIGKNSIIGKETWLGGSPAHYFEVTLVLPKADMKSISIARDLIELEKPAHTFYDLKVEFPSMEIGVSRVGIDTLLGTVTKSA